MGFGYSPWSISKLAQVSSNHESESLATLLFSMPGTAVSDPTFLFKVLHDVVVSHRVEASRSIEVLGAALDVERGLFFLSDQTVRPVLSWHLPTAA
jgi:hypothetical protein